MHINKFFSLIELELFVNRIAHLQVTSYKLQPYLMYMAIIEVARKGVNIFLSIEYLFINKKRVFT